MDGNKLISTYSTLYHVTASKHWESTLEYGLLSAIDLAAVCGIDRDDIVGERRATCKKVSAPNSSLNAVIRDQEPLNVDKLLRYIKYQGNRITLERWLERQSERVFFFVSEKVARSMADKYEKKGQSQTMIVVNTESLVNAHHDKIDLSAYNSGFNRTDPKDPAARPRWYKLYHEMFLPIDEYPYDTWCDRRRKPTESPIVEVTVRGCVPDLKTHFERVFCMNGELKSEKRIPRKSNSSKGRFDLRGENAMQNDSSEQKRNREPTQNLLSGINRSVRQKLEDFNTTPERNISSWLDRTVEGVDLIKHNYQQDDDVIVYAMSWNFFLHAVLVPSKNVIQPDHKDLSKCKIMPESCWSEWISYQQGKPNIELRDPFNDIRCKSLVGGEKLIYRRYLEGAEKESTTIEINQKISHSLNLHYVPNENAYCTIDKRGNLVKIIYMHISNCEEYTKAIKFVTINREYLDRYLALTEMSMVSNFDLQRRLDRSHRTKEEKRYEHEERDIYFSSYTVPDDFSVVRGHMVYRTAVTKSSLVLPRQDREDNEKDQYETFTIHDFKNNQIVDSSCSPDSISNYFEKSDLPYYTSPAFFSDDVLSKYINEPEKYTIHQNTITCRGAWSLQSFGTNDAHQVYAYIGDLGKLPFKEQKHWASCNEKPKGGISESSFEADFLGIFPSESDPLEELKDIVRRLNSEAPVWWRRRSDDLIGEVQFAITKSTKIWGSEILALYKMVVDGFSANDLRKFIASIDKPVDDDAKVGSIILLEKIITCIESSPDIARTISSPLRDLNNLRNKIPAHDSGSEREKIISQMRKDFADTRSHFYDLVTRVRDSMKYIEKKIPRKI